MVSLILFYLFISSIVFFSITLMSNNKISVMLFHALTWFIWYPIYTGGILASITHAIIHNFSFYYSAQKIFSNNKLLRYIDQALIDIEEL